MMLGIVGDGTTLICARGCPQMNMPDRYLTSSAVTASSELGSTAIRLVRAAS
jgi:hypothetical protein